MRVILEIAIFISGPFYLLNDLALVTAVGSLSLFSNLTYASSGPKSFVHMVVCDSLCVHRPIVLLDLLRSIF